MYDVTITWSFDTLAEAVDFERLVSSFNFTQSPKQVRMVQAVNQFIPKGTTLPDAGGDDILAVVTKTYPDARAVVILTDDQVHTMTQVSTLHLIEVLSQYVRDMATEMGMPS